MSVIILAINSEYSLSDLNPCKIEETAIKTASPTVWLEISRFSDESIDSEILNIANTSDWAWD